DLLWPLADADVVAQRLRHRLLSVEALEEREDPYVLRLLTVGLLDLPAEEQVEQLVGASDLHVGSNGDGVIRLVERVEDLVRAYWRAGFEPVGEILALEYLLQGGLAHQPQDVGRRHLAEPLRIALALCPG